MSQRVVVVGYCASGKSTVVSALKERGIDALAVAQEHSVIQNLWNHQDPDLVVFLDVSIEAIRARRGNPAWPEWIYELQRERLASARERADLVIDTSSSGVDDVVRRILDLVNGKS